MNTSANIIGIAGTFASGQDTLAKHLADTLGYYRFSTSDAVRGVAMARYGSIERPVLHETGAELRAERGAGALVLLGIDKLSDARGVIITGIRSMGELKEIVAHGGTMLFTDADKELRYQRMVARSRDKEVELTREQFEDREMAEFHTGDNDSDFNRRDIRAFCEERGAIIHNDNNLEAFYDNALAYLNA